MVKKLRNGRGVWRGRELPHIHHAPRVKFERGQELVEFLISLPLLILIAFGAVDLGRLFHAYITIQNAAREGARYGSTFPPVDQAAIDDIIAITQREALDSGINLYDTTISDVSTSCPEGTCGGGHPVRVAVQYDFTVLMGFFLADPTLTLNASAQMVIN